MGGNLMHNPFEYQWLYDLYVMVDKAGPPGLLEDFHLISHDDLRGEYRFRCRRAEDKRSDVETPTIIRSQS